MRGDFDADGKSDIAAQLGLVGGGWRVLMFRGSALGVPATWFSTSPAGGDADGDGLADLAWQEQTGGTPPHFGP